MTRMIRQLSTCAAILVCISVPSFAQETVEEKPSKLSPQEMIIGTWKLEKAKSPSGVGTRLKFYTETHFCVIEPDPVTGEIIFQHGGRYAFDGKTLSETIDFAGESTATLIGQTFKLTIEVGKDRFKQVDPDGAFTETWKREKKPDGKK